MNTHQTRIHRARLGFCVKSTAILAACMAVFALPVRVEGDNVEAPSDSFSVVDSTLLSERIEAATAAVMDAFNRRDREAYLAAFADEAIIAAEGIRLLFGRSDIAELYLQSPEGSVYEPMVWADRRMYQVGDWLLETGLVDFRFRPAQDAPILNDPRQVFTIWKQAPDGSLQVKLLSWNKLAETEALRRRTPIQAFACKRAGEPFGRDGDFAGVLEAEERFHRTFDTRSVEEAAGFYSEGATLIAPQTLPLRGRTAILDYLQSLSPEQFAISVEREVAYVEGNKNHVLVVNLFRWKFKPPESQFPVPISGKGIHLWECGEDGVWRILFDLPNSSQRTS